MRDYFQDKPSKTNALPKQTLINRSNQSIKSISLLGFLFAALRPTTASSPEYSSPEYSCCSERELQPRSLSAPFSMIMRGSYVWEVLLATLPSSIITLSLLYHNMLPFGRTSSGELPPITFVNISSTSSPFFRYILLQLHSSGALPIPLTFNRHT